jgi:hypothetical protein
METLQKLRADAGNNSNGTKSDYSPKVNKFVLESQFSLLDTKVADEIIQTLQSFSMDFHDGGRWVALISMSL